MHTANLLLSILFGALGLGYVVYGRRQRKGSALIAGVGLMVFPYFVASMLATLALGFALVVAPLFVDF